MLGGDLFTEMGITINAVPNQDSLETFAVQQTWGEKMTSSSQSTMIYLKMSYIGLLCDICLLCDMEMHVAVVNISI